MDTVKHTLTKNQAFGKRKLFYWHSLALCVWIYLCVCMINFVSSVYVCLFSMSFVP